MKTVTLAFGLFMLGGYHEIMTTHDSDIQLTGETVTINYVANPSVGHGQFHLENHGTVAVKAAVESAWLKLGEHRHPLIDITVFDLGQDQMLNLESFKVDAKATLSFLLGFPKVAHEPRFGESSAVGLRLRVDGAELQALSPIKFVRRFPYGF